MELTKYHPPIRRLQLDFAARIARRKYIAARGPRPPKGMITDNSEPWLANPNSVADDWFIACKVNERLAGNYRESHFTAEPAAWVAVAKQPCMR